MHTSGIFHETRWAEFVWSYPTSRDIPTLYEKVEIAEAFLILILTGYAWRRLEVWDTTLDAMACCRIPLDWVTTVISKSYLCFPLPFSISKLPHTKCIGEEVAVLIEGGSQVDLTRLTIMTITRKPYLDIYEEGTLHHNSLDGSLEASTEKSIIPSLYLKQRPT